MRKQMPVMAAKQYKDRVFRSVFAEKKDLLELYNALRGSNYRNPEELEINTLDNALYIGMKNDLSFLIDDEINLYEHQSTINPNMPLRGLLYLTDLLRGYIDKNGKKLYGSGRIALPTPHYVVFYNGAEEQPDIQTRKLSESYAVKDGPSPCLEMEAVVLNVNLGYNQELMERSRKLYEYAQFVAVVRRCRETEKDLTLAVNLAIDECIRDDILSEFLRKNRAEVVDMLLYEYNEEEHIASEKELSYAEGEAEGERRGKALGKAEDILELLEELGEVPEELRNAVFDQRSLDVLTCWLKLAANAKTLEEFECNRIKRIDKA